MDPSQSSLNTELYELFSRFNKTELYQLCRKAGLSAQPSWTREQYIAALIGESEYNARNIFDYARDALIHFIDEYWSVLQAQLKCPARNLHHPDPEKRDPKPCYRCVDMQVSACIAELSPANQQRLYQLGRKSDCDNNDR